MLETISMDATMTSGPVKTHGSTEQTAASNSTPSKLRDSCHACAESKVKCPKEKPTCSRCKRRNVDCQYAVIKRPGRKRALSPSRRPSIVTSSNDTANKVSKLSHTGRSPPQLAMVVNTSPTPLSPRRDSPGLSHDLLQISTTEFSPWIDPNGDFSALSKSPSASSFPQVTNTDFDVLFDTPLNSFDFDLVTPESAGYPDISHAFNFEPPSLTLSACIDTDTDDKLDKSANTLPTPDSPSSGGCQVPSVHCQGSDKFGAGSLMICSCSCMQQVLKLMGVFFTDSPMTDSSLEENTVSMETISSILLCSQVHDTYLLTILAMFISKIIDRYAAAVTKQTQDAAGGVSEKSTAGRGHMQRRMKAQSVLGELHRVQRLINQLTPRLEAWRMEETMEETGTRAHVDSTGYPSFASAKLGNPAPFSAARVAQIEADLRTGLTDLSAGIISILRQI